LPLAYLALLRAYPALPLALHLVSFRAHPAALHLASLPELLALLRAYPALPPALSPVSFRHPAALHLASLPGLLASRRALFRARPALLRGYPAALHLALRLVSMSQADSLACASSTKATAERTPATRCSPRRLPPGTGLNPPGRRGLFARPQRNHQSRRGWTPCSFQPCCRKTVSCRQAGTCRCPRNRDVGRPYRR